MGVFYAILMLLAHLISMVIGILMDSSSPYVEWDDEYSALRGNLNTFFNMAIMMVFSAVVVGLGILMYELLKLPIGVFYSAIFVILLGVMLRMVTVGKKKIIINMGNL
jgi:ABC-2 type transport system permease protein